MHLRSRSMSDRSAGKIRRTFDCVEKDMLSVMKKSVPCRSRTLVAPAQMIDAIVATAIVWNEFTNEKTLPRSCGGGRSRAEVGGAGR
eukprot:2070210-Prymnesium_polylepis.1